MKDSLTAKFFVISLVGGMCLVASFLVWGAVEERKGRFVGAKAEIAQSWGEYQNVVGPMLFVNGKPGVDGSTPKTFYVLPETVQYETVLEPEVRSRGIFRSVVYVSKLKVAGEFSAVEIREVARQDLANMTLAMAITDTRGIAEQFNLTWNGTSYPFRPGAGLPAQAGAAFENSSGLHVVVPLATSATRIPFAFELKLRGSEGLNIAPVGEETTISVSSLWPSPKFAGAFLPTSHEINAAGFQSDWQISSFGRAYPQVGEMSEFTSQQFLGQMAGVELYDAVDFYTKISRSLKYAALFIVITFATFFIFELLLGLRIHPLQYLFIGAALALFYLLLLALAEHLGFLPAYLIATVMTSLLITFYSARVLQSHRRAFPILIVLLGLYGYLYFVLRLEDYALLFGALLLFVLLAVAMYLTRNVNWFAVSEKTPSN